MTDGPRDPDGGPAAADLGDLTEAERLDIELHDYVDGALAPPARAALEARLAAEPALRAQLEEIRATLGAVRGLGRAPAPADLGAEVEATIHRRSGGRFFGRRAFGDRVPFGALLIVALVVLGAVAALLWSSSTGSLRVEPRDAPRPPPEARELVPRP